MATPQPDYAILDKLKQQALGEQDAPLLQSSFMPSGFAPPAQQSAAPYQQYPLPQSVAGLAPPPPPGVGSPVASNMPMAQPPGMAPVAAGYGDPNAGQAPTQQSMAGDMYDKLGQVFNANTANAETANLASLSSYADQKDAVARGAQASMDENTLRGAEGNERQKIDDQAISGAEQHQTRMAELQRQFDKDNANQLVKVKSAVDDASQMQMHSFWQDKSVGSRILGMIAQALSGAANGLSGNPSAPTPLDRIINQDMERQMADQQNKRAVANEQMSVYGQMLRATGNRLDAETAFYQAGNRQVALAAQKLADKFATPIAEAANKKIQADLAEKNAGLEERRQTIAQQNFSRTAMDALNAMGNMSTGGAGGTYALKQAETYNPLTGMDASDAPLKTKTTPAIYNKAVAATTGLSSYLTTLSHAASLLDQPNGIELFNQYGIDHDISFAKGRSDSQLGLGKRLEGSEESMANRMAPGYLKSYIGGDITKARQTIEALQNAWGRIYVEELRSVNPNAKLDYSHPVLGPIFARIEALNRQAKRKQAAPNGR